MTATGSEATGADVIEIRPVPPQGRPLPADRSALRTWVLRADVRHGTLTLTEDRPLLITPSRTLTLALPATGRPDAVRTVCLASYWWRRNVPEYYRRRDLANGVTWRLLFLDAGGSAPAMQGIEWRRTRHVVGAAADALGLDQVAEHGGGLQGADPRLGAGHVGQQVNVGYVEVRDRPEEHQFVVDHSARA